MRALIVLFACACASAQDAADDGPATGLLLADAARLVHHEDPVVRGEAALILAEVRDPEHHAAIVAVARDEHSDARLRGLLALGRLATPDVVNLLAEALEDTTPRGRQASIVAAFALGSLPPDLAPGEVSRRLSGFLQGSMKRQREVMLALLGGLQANSQAGHAAPLVRVLADDSNRDPEVRARLLELLLPIDGVLEFDQVAKPLARGSDAEQLAILEWLAAGPTPFDGDLLQALEHAALRAARPDQRAAALAALTRLRHLPALEIAAKALRSAHAVEVEQGVRSALALGGSSMCGVLEQRLRSEPDPITQAAMLRAFGAPPSRDLAADCARLAADRRAPMALRAAAASVLARSDPARAAPLLRDLFREAGEAETLAGLARAVLAGGGGLPALTRLVVGSTDLRLHPQRWLALLAAGHPEAVRQVLERVQGRSESADDLALALRVWRLAALRAVPPGRAARLPEPLRELLGW